MLKINLLLGASARKKVAKFSNKMSKLADLTSRRAEVLKSQERLLL